MAKSVLHALVGMLVAEDRLELDAPADVPMWRGDDDPRRHITLDQLLAMRDGLDFVENYVDAGRSDVIEMLFGSGKDDVAHFAADRPLVAPPGERFNYSSGTSNVVSGIVARAVGAGQPYEDFLQTRLFDAISMRSARATFDPAGTFIASSFVYCHRPRLRPVRDAVPAATACGTVAACSRGMGRPRPPLPVDGRGDRQRVRVALVGRCRRRRDLRGRSGPTGTRASR